MAEVEIAYKGSLIASMDTSGSKTLLTSGKYCEDDIAVYYSRPSGGSNTPVAEATITNVTASGGDRSFDVTLSRTITKGVVLFEADATTQTAILADTSTTYYILSILSLYPVDILTRGNTTYVNHLGCIVFRGSTGIFSSRGGNSTALTIAINGTTMTVTWNVNALGVAYPGGTYKVTVWEVADS